ncbi:MAG TPA: GNAT family N-acetyltransferase, partial [Streptosporangiaceae bacterium]
MHIVLETPRLTLRQFTEDDVENLLELNSDPEVMRYLNGGGATSREKLRDEVIPFHLAVYQRFDRLGTWAAESPASGEFLGWFHFRPGPGTDLTNIDLGYRLRRAAWNKGYATE